MTHSDGLRHPRHPRSAAAALGHAHLTSTAFYTTVIGAQARELVARM